jgi:Bax protein
MNIKYFFLYTWLFALSAFSSPQNSFLQFLHPHIVRANAELTKQRETLLSIDQKRREATQLSPQELTFIGELARLHRLERFDRTKGSHWDELIERVDIVPAPLALAQAATESGWGQSRFAKEGHNYFGQWCFTFSCGIIPRQRALGAKHEVKRFSSPYQSVLSYVRNINSHPAYGPVRQIRAKLRGEGRALKGHALARGLSKYSQRGDAYIREVQAIISRHGLERFKS